MARAITLKTGTRKTSVKRSKITIAVEIVAYSKQTVVAGKSISARGANAGTKKPTSVKSAPKAALIANTKPKPKVTEAKSAAVKSKSPAKKSSAKLATSRPSGARKKAK